MTKTLKCPFCQQELEKDDLDVQLFGCENQNCKHNAGYDFVGTKELWQELIHTKELLDVESAEHEMCHTQMLKTTEKLERTRKALEVAVDALKKTLNGCESYDADYGVCYTALEQITALKQKE